MTQKSNRIIVDTNRHGIRREINLDALWNRSQKKKEKKLKREENRAKF